LSEELHLSHLVKLLHLVEFLELHEGLYLLGLLSLVHFASRVEILCSLVINLLVLEELLKKPVLRLSVALFSRMTIKMWIILRSKSTMSCVLHLLNTCLCYFLGVLTEDFV